MHIDGFIPQQSVEFDTKCDNRKDAVKEFKKKYPQARVDNIDGVFVRGLCEGCEEPVMEDDEGYGYGQEDNIYLCPPCAKREKESEDHESRS